MERPGSSIQKTSIAYLFSLLYWKYSGANIIFRYGNNSCPFLDGKKVLNKYSTTSRKNAQTFCTSAAYIKGNWKTAVLLETECMNHENVDQSSTENRIF